MMNTDGTDRPISNIAQIVVWMLWHYRFGNSDDFQTGT